MSGWLDTIGAGWAWVIAGVVLAVAELLAPGVFLIWLGLACLLTGLVVALVAPLWPVQVLTFAVFAAVAVLIGRRLTRHAPSDLNRRGDRLIGQDFVLGSPIVDGVGRLNLGDTSWRITGPDLPGGARVRVVSLDGVTLVVEAVV